MATSRKTSNSAVNTKQELLGYDKKLIIDELHKILNTQQIAKLINNLRQSLSNPNQKKQADDGSLTGKALDDAINEAMEQLNLPKKARDSILKLPEQQKQIMLEQYKGQLQTKSPPPPPSTTGVVVETEEDRNRKNTFIIPDKGDIVIRGWLHKKGKRNKDWKKRWFVLYHNNNLVYYEKAEDVSNDKISPKGELPLYDITKCIKKAREDDKVGKKYKFELISRQRTFVLKAEDERAYNQWINKISIRIHPNILHKGWAKKQGGGKKTWKERYFVLVNYEKINSELRYYEDKKMEKFKGLIDVSEISNLQIISGKDCIKKYGKGNDKCLELITAKRIFVLSFKDINVREQWKNEITNVVFDDDVNRHISNPIFKPSISGAHKVNKLDDIKEEKQQKNNNNDNLKIDLKINPLHSGVEVVAETEKEKEKEKEDEKQYDEEQQQQQNEEEQEQQQQQEEEEVDDESSGFGLDITEDTGDIDDDDDDDYNNNDDEAQLPPDWIVLYTDDGREYYHNEATGVTQWTQPEM